MGRQVGGGEAGKSVEARRTEFAGKSGDVLDAKERFRKVSIKGQRRPPPRVLASEIRDGKYRNQITIGRVRMKWTFNTER